MVKLSDIAEKCGVSISAVSLAINKPHKISREQKEKILRVAHELGYLNKKNRKISKILLVFDNFHDCYFGEYYNKVIFGILDSLYTENIAVQILSDFNVEYSDIYDNSGIVFVGKTPTAFLEKANDFKIPYVLCGHPIADPDTYSIRFDIERGVDELIDYVISCGHSKIGLILGETEENDIIHQAIISSCSKALERNKLKLNKELIEYAGFNDLQTIETAVNKLLKNKVKPTVIFCSNDHFAYITYRILKKWKIKIPTDISIVGFDGIKTPFHLEPPTPTLTTVMTDHVDLGRKSIALLKDLINNPTLEQKQHLLPVQLSVGDSVKRIK